MWHRESWRKNVLWDNKRSIFSLTCNCESEEEYIMKISEDTSIAGNFSKFDADYKSRGSRSSTPAE